MTPLHPHQHNALVALLRSPEWAGLSAEDAFARLSADKNLGGLRLLCFVSPEKYARTPEKRRGRFVVVEGGFPGGVPGYPNVMRRAHFDKAFAEARG
jgi:hypothetical protein